MNVWLYKNLSFNKRSKIGINQIFCYFRVPSTDPGERGPLHPGRLSSAAAVPGGGQRGAARLHLLVQGEGSDQLLGQGTRPDLVLQPPHRPSLQPPHQAGHAGRLWQLHLRPGQLQAAQCPPQHHQRWEHKGSLTFLCKYLMGITTIYSYKSQMNSIYWYFIKPEWISLCKISRLSNKVRNNVPLCLPVRIFFPNKCQLHLS